MPLAGWLCERIGSRRVTVAALVGGSALALPRFAGQRPRRTRCGPLRLRRGLRRDQRVGERARARARATVRALDPLLVPRRLQRRRARRRWPRRARSRARDRAARALRSRSRSCSPWVPSREDVGCCRAEADDSGPHAPSSARPRVLLVLGAAAFFTLLAEGAAADWSAVYLSDSLGATAAVAALGVHGLLARHGGEPAASATA